MSGRLVRVVLAIGIVASSAPAGAVVGGTDADAGEYPWMAAIFRGEPNRTELLGGQFCGGSLIAPAVVISAAHCINDLVDSTLGMLPVDPAGLGVSVMLGETRLDGSGGERIRVRSFHLFPHPNSDIAVLRLWEPSSLTPIRWAGPDDLDLYEAGTMATVTGWGATNENGGYPNTLKEARVPIVSDLSCSQSYPGQIDPTTMVCAGYPQGGTDTCGGDSGGPIMVPDREGGFVLIGTTWFGDGCARPNAPGVYAETAPAHAFIISNVLD